MPPRSKMSKIVLGLLVVFFVVGGIFIFTKQSNAPTQDLPPADRAHSTDATLPGPYTIEKNHWEEVSDGSVITIDGDLNIAGGLRCNNGPLTVIVNGALNVTGSVYCERSQDIAENDLGIALAIVGKGLVNFAPSAEVSVNGHVVIVNDESKLPQTQQELEELYDNAAADTGDGLRIGPFIEIPLDASQVLVPASEEVTHPNESVLQALGIGIAHAAEPAVDQFGNQVDNTVRIGGRWIVGSPANLPPDALQIPTPPKKIKKIIVAFNFGPSGSIDIRDFTLYGPDGREGTEDTASCNVKGGKGENAFRLNITAPTVSIGDFDLYLGYGGAGGFAETSTDCEHGQATGGDGGEPSNFKIVGTQSLSVVGSFNVHPGQGGTGGQAVAHGRDGENGCPAENGGKATARGGKGGDNKKGLKVTGQVAGIANITIDEIVAGAGGDADAFGGKGGSGDACGCGGGNGGGAIAIGGMGGAATSRTVASTGGDGGAVSSEPGTGGSGGSCGPDKTGGNGGDGGAATVTPGKPGTGRTAPGNEGPTFDETGGDGGNGGDGCQPGDGGTGGSGDPDGEDGEDGKNLCVIEEKKEETYTDPREDEDITPPTTYGEEIDDEVKIQIAPFNISFTYDHANPRCPLPITPIQINGPADVEWWVETSGLPVWLQTSGATQGVGPGTVPLQFPCLLESYVNQQQSTSITVGATSAGGQQVEQNVNVNGNFTNF